MEIKNAFDGKNVIVFGLGKTGLSLASYAAQRGARVRVLDTRENPPCLGALRSEIPAAQFEAGVFDPAQTKLADCVLVSPGVGIAEPAIASARRRGVEVAGDIELFARHIPADTKIIGITGSNGKTTTTALTGALCAAAGMATLVAGNIGATVLDELAQIERATRWPECIVLELSSFQLETTSSLQCTAATVLNVSEDHLDRYPSYFEYFSVKARLFAQTRLQIINRDDPIVVSMTRKDRAAVSFGANAPAAGAWGLREGWLVFGDARIIEINDLKLLGRHNQLNALASLALTPPHVAPTSAIVDALRSFEGLSHRMMRVAEKRGVVYIDDSKGTNVGATVAALSGLTQKVILIAGGDGKGQDFTPLLDGVRRHARAVQLIGRDADAIAQALAGSGVSCTHASSLEAAVLAASAQAKSGDMVLLSPACASLDMFRNYAHRSEVFINAVKELSDA